MIVTRTSDEAPPNHGDLIPNCTDSTRAQAQADTLHDHSLRLTAEAEINARVYRSIDRNFMEQWQSIGRLQTVIRRLSEHQSKR